MFPSEITHVLHYDMDFPQGYSAFDKLTQIECFNLKHLNEHHVLRTSNFPVHKFKFTRKPFSCKILPKFKVIVTVLKYVS